MGSKSRKFVDVISVNLAMSEKLDQLVVESTTARRVFETMMYGMDRDNTVKYTYKDLYNKLGISVATITRAIKLLKDGGFIEIKRYGSFNIYTVNKDIAFKSKRLTEVL